MGDAAILLISPEQLRNPSVRAILKQREIGYWVIDEAHCLSKWGQDFRPDYRYISRFIREYSGDDPPAPLICLTATAKPSVLRDILDHFDGRLGVELQLINGGAFRDNLAFEVIETTQARSGARRRLRRRRRADNAGLVELGQDASDVVRRHAFAERSRLGGWSPRRSASRATARLEVERLDFVLGDRDDVAPAPVEVLALAARSVCTVRHRPEADGLVDARGGKPTAIGKRKRAVRRSPCGRRRDGAPRPRPGRCGPRRRLPLWPTWSRSDPGRRKERAGGKGLSSARSRRSRTG